MQTIVTFVPDLMFGTRIEDTAKHLGYRIESLSATDDPDAVMARLSPALVVVALDAAGWERTIAAAKRAGARVLAFGSHKNVELLRAAKAAGADEVVARSRMAAEMPNLLQSLSK
ncbi:MAG: hypothetical protein HY782_10190 [Chloroflexi bacterium]|nr:hypothetical protein [Chloroflexota bacterium]